MKKDKAREFKLKNINKKTILISGIIFSLSFIAVVGLLFLGMGLFYNTTDGVDWENGIYLKKNGQIEYLPIFKMDIVGEPEISNWGTEGIINFSDIVVKNGFQDKTLTYRLDIWYMGEEGYDGGVGTPSISKFKMFPRKESIELGKLDPNETATCHFSIDTSKVRQVSQGDWDTNKIYVLIEEVAVSNVLSSQVVSKRFYTLSPYSNNEGEEPWQEWEANEYNPDLPSPVVVIKLPESIEADEETTGKVSIYYEEKRIEMKYQIRLRGCLEDELLYEGTTNKESDDKFKVEFPSTCNGGSMAFLVITESKDMDGKWYNEVGKLVEIKIEKNGGGYWYDNEVVIAIAQYIGFEDGREMNDWMITNIGFVVVVSLALCALFVVAMLKGII